MSPTLTESSSEASLTTIINANIRGYKQDRCIFISLLCTSRSVSSPDCYGGSMVSRAQALAFCGSPSSSCGFLLVVENGHSNGQQEGKKGRRFPFFFSRTHITSTHIPTARPSLCPHQTAWEAEECGLWPGSQFSSC